MLLKGVLLALTAGALHSANDLMRKAAHSRLGLSSTALVTLCAIIDAFLVGTAFILVGEQPTVIGLAGVGIVTLGGYLLSQVATSPDATDVPKHSSDLSSNPKDEGDELLQDVREDGNAAMYPTGLGGKATRRSGSAGAGMDKLGAGGGTRSCWERIAQLPRQPRLSGSLMMLCVAAAWSITASLDKLGVRYGSLWTYFAAQRLIIGMHEQACAACTHP
ncbi:hypothetical protein DUNSADRAFT_3914 [Dunaliella salina]|uniref:Uncharacterized protein n=1 Tax=Dunaliella salina TaxID=3046 RepID=A0ABQ7GT51_DUNSA|nr:hypothetical protein DUNSADRAFT_3914 [Dunaliella salina]|eukprot:KAF5837771.1 hypothetical protein DUNSADRAFT_3914 [Dunaliella salina]